MSRIGRKAVGIPNGVTHTYENGVFTAQGPKGKEVVNVPEGIILTVKDATIEVSRKGDTKVNRANHGLIRNLVNNALIGVSEGYVRKLDIHGVGFKAQPKGKVVTFSLGYSHDIDYEAPEGVTITIPQPTHVILESANKVLVGREAAKIRSFFKPEPYKGKGVRYSNEQIRRKQGKVVG